MLIDIIYLTVGIVSVVVIVSLFLKFKTVGEMKECYIIQRSSHPLHINNSCQELNDNLQLIRGIGKVLERVLHENGIYCFRQIAQWTKEDITKINKLISFPGRIEREQWIEQARGLINNSN